MPRKCKTIAFLQKKKKETGKILYQWGKILESFHVRKMRERFPICRRMRKNP